MRIGVLGGSFDPIHNAHLIVAQVAREVFDLAVVHLVVAAEQPFKVGRHAAPAASRMEMVRLAVAGVPGVVADDRELRRAGPSYTVDTLRDLRRDDPTLQIVLLIGADSAAGFDRWHEPQAIRELATIAVCRRAGAPASDLPGAVQFDVPAMEISSTAIRERVARGKSLAGWVPPAVADYIVASQVYGSLNG